MRSSKYIQGYSSRYWSFVGVALKTERCSFTIDPKTLTNVNAEYAIFDAS